MYPLTLLKMAYNQPMLVELKNGETYNGNLASCDTWMNLHLRGEVICTSKDGDSFWKMPEVYIRGSMIKYLRLPDEVMDIAKQHEKDGGKRRRRDDRGDRGDRGDNRGDRGDHRGDRGDHRGNNRGAGDKNSASQQF